MGNLNGYIRVSTRDQNEDRQLIALRELKIPEKKTIFFISKALTDLDATMRKL